MAGATFENIPHIRSIDFTGLGVPMAKQVKRAALYVRVSTDAQTVENQIRELSQVAERRRWEVVEIYRDAGISGAKGRGQRPNLDRMLKDACRRKFDVVMAWAIDRLGRSLVDLLGTIQGLEACGVDLYLEQQHIDTTTPVGKLLFQITGDFAEFERSMIRTRVRAGLKRAKDQIKRDGHFVTKHGEVRKRLGRPGAEPDKLRKARAELDKGIGIVKVAKQVGLGVGTVAKLKREMGANS
jgi:DNA invertase Pin-like site-specific DNA recombinase